jgi:curved DNA-binding protein CbpA
VLSTQDIRAAYRVLNVPTTATADQVRRNYLDLARRLHPDVNGGDDTKMKAVNLAYEAVQAHAATGAPLADTPDGAPSAATEDERRRAYYYRRSRGAAAKGGDGETDGAKGRASGFSNERSAAGRSDMAWTSAIFNVTEAERLDPRNHPRSFNANWTFTDDSAIFRHVRAGASIPEAARAIGRTPYAVEARMNSAQFKLRIRAMLQGQRKEFGTHSGGVAGGAAVEAAERVASEARERNAAAASTSASGAAAYRAPTGSVRAQQRFQRQVQPDRDAVYRNPAAAAFFDEDLDDADEAARRGQERFRVVPEGKGLPSQRRMGGGRGGGDDDDGAGWGGNTEFRPSDVRSPMGRSYSNLARFMRR